MKNIVNILWVIIINKNWHYNMKYSILTCIFGDYEILRQPWYPDPDCEYVCVTDRDDLDTNGSWKIVKLNPILQTMPFVNQWTYVRYHPFEFVSTDTCLYIDGSILVVDGVKLTEAIIEPFMNGNFIYGIMPNLNQVNCTIQQDIDIWENNRSLSPMICNKIRKYLKENDYNVLGMLQSGFLMYKKCQDCDIINNTTWELCHLWSYSGNNVDRNNQIDLSYTINKLHYKSDRIFRVSALMLNSCVLQIFHHGSDTVAWYRSGSDYSYFCDELLINHIIRTPELETKY